MNPVSYGALAKFLNNWSGMKLRLLFHGVNNGSQCYQMARLFFNIWLFFNNENLPNGTNHWPKGTNHLPNGTNNLPQQGSKLWISSKNAQYFWNFAKVVNFRQICSHWWKLNERSPTKEGERLLNAIHLKSRFVVSLLRNDIRIQMFKCVAHSDETLIKLTMRSGPGPINILQRKFYAMLIFKQA